jgi:arylsulfatase A-like enzyme
MNTTETTDKRPFDHSQTTIGKPEFFRQPFYRTQKEPACGQTLRQRTIASSILAASLVCVALAGSSVGAADSTKVPAWPPLKKAPPGAPNVVLILLDDTGYGFTSTFGGPVPTPNLDKLANQGLRYNNFHVNAMCSPTRAALLSGRNSHQVGFGRIAESANSAPGYNSLWPKHVVPLAEVLKRHGYSTAAFGKWHNTPTWEVNPAGPFDHWPTSLGFEHFYGFLSAATSQYEPILFHNTDPVDVTKTPDEGYLLNPDLVNHAKNWLHQHDASASDRPFFLYLATGAIHTPHHVPHDWVEKFKGKFDKGWDQQREETFARQKALGIIPPSAEFTPRPDELPAWDSYSADEKKVLAAQAEVYAAYLAETDYELGRLFDDIKAAGHTNDTVFFLIIGDNGASAEGGLSPWAGYGGPTNVQDKLAHVGELGSKDLNTHVHSGWAWAANAPFRWAKRTASHLGGTTDPLIVSWPGHLPADGSVRKQFSFVTDIAPTIYELAHIEFPQEVDGVKQLPLEGNSLVSTFNDPQAPSQHTHQYFEMIGNRGIYKDGWWAGSRKGLPWGSGAGFGGEQVEPGKWDLYDLTKDFTQAHDLAEQNPEKLKELTDYFASEAERNHVYPVDERSSRFDFGGPGGRDAADAGTNRPTKWTYHGGASRISGQYTPRLNGNSHVITAKIDSGSARPNGVIFALGGRTGGVVLFVKDGKVIFEGSGQGGAQHIQIASPRILPPGKAEIKIIATRAKDAADGESGSAQGFEQRGNSRRGGGSASTAGNGSAAAGAPRGNGRRGGFGGGNFNASYSIALVVNERPVANGTFKGVSYGAGGGGLSIGSNKGTPVSLDYTGTNPFNGEVNEVVFDASPLESDETP